MSSETGVVFLFDVDNTLFDNDRFRQDLRERLQTAHGEVASARYWGLMDELWDELGYMDYFGALARLRIEHPLDPENFRTANWILDYPFADRLYPHALDVVTHVRRWGLPVILSDGDEVLQPLKIMRSGLLKAFDGHVLVYIHKEKALDGRRAALSGRPLCARRRQGRILAAVKLAWSDRVTTVFPKQGHYARDEPPRDPASVDRTIEGIGDLLGQDWSSLT